MSIIIACAGCGTQLYADGAVVLCLGCEDALNPTANRASLWPTRMAPAPATRILERRELLPWN